MTTAKYLKCTIGDCRRKAIVQFQDGNGTQRACKAHKYTTFGAYYGTQKAL